MIVFTLGNKIYLKKKVVTQAACVTIQYIYPLLNVNEMCFVYTLIHFL